MPPLPTQDDFRLRQHQDAVFQRFQRYFNITGLPIVRPTLPKRMTVFTRIPKKPPSRPQGQSEHTQGQSKQTQRQLPRIFRQREYDIIVDGRHMFSSMVTDKKVHHFLTVMMFFLETFEKILRFLKFPITTVVEDCQHISHITLATPLKIVVRLRNGNTYTFSRRRSDRNQIKIVMTGSKSLSLLNLVDEIQSSEEIKRFLKNICDFIHRYYRRRKN